MFLNTNFQKMTDVAEKPNEYEAILGESLRRQEEKDEGMTHY